MTEYSHVTEIPGDNASAEQIERLYQRYCFAAEYAKDKEVLEVASGSGLGLGLLAQVAKRVVGGDIDEKLLAVARRTYKNKAKIEIIPLDAQQLPFADQSFDVIILYEAIYYIPQVEKFIKEASRVLKDKGILILCTVNKDWADFNPSPHSIKYFNVPELYGLLHHEFSKVVFRGSYTSIPKTFKDKLISVTKRIAVKMHLIPKTMKGKEWLKRVFFGRLTPLPAEIKTGDAKYFEPVLIPADSPNYDYKVIFATAHLG